MYNSRHYLICIISVSKMLTHLLASLAIQAHTPFPANVSCSMRLCKKGAEAKEEFMYWHVDSIPGFTIISHWCRCDLVWFYS